MAAATSQMDATAQQFTSQLNNRTTLIQRSIDASQAAEAATKVNTAKLDALGGEVKAMREEHHEAQGTRTLATNALTTAANAFSTIMARFRRASGEGRMSSSRPSTPRERCWRQPRQGLLSSSSRCGRAVRPPNDLAASPSANDLAGSPPRFDSGTNARAATLPPRPGNNQHPPPADLAASTHGLNVNEPVGSNGQHPLFNSLAASPSRLNANEQGDNGGRAASAPAASQPNVTPHQGAAAGAVDNGQPSRACKGAPVKRFGFEKDDGYEIFDQSQMQTQAPDSFKSADSASYDSRSSSSSQDSYSQELNEEQESQLLVPSVSAKGSRPYHDQVAASSTELLGVQRQQLALARRPRRTRRHLLPRPRRPAPLQLPPPAPQPTPPTPAAKEARSPSTRWKTSMSPLCEARIRRSQ